MNPATIASSTATATSLDVVALRAANQTEVAQTTDRPEILAWLGLHGEVRARAAVAFSPYVPDAVLRTMLVDPALEVRQAATFASEGALCV